MDEIVCYLALQHISFYSGTEGLSDILVFVVLGQEYDLRFWGRLFQFAGGVNAIQNWHADVHDGHIRLTRSCHVQRFLSIRSLAGNLESVFFKQCLQALPNESMIVRK
jgi:hypothetical protein